MDHKEETLVTTVNNYCQRRKWVTKDETIGEKREIYMYWQSKLTINNKCWTGEFMSKKNLAKEDVARKAYSFLKRFSSVSESIGESVGVKSESGHCIYETCEVFCVPTR